MDGVKIGLETHVQLDTNTKLFCGCPARDADKPNTHTCEICLGMPGSKPRTNEAVIEYALRAGLALDCEIADELVFSRKTYFYPDMSKNFQITQYEAPIAADGSIVVDGAEIGITRAHIEEDPAKILHQGGSITTADYTLIDYNRAGRPLLEIVTEPDFTDPAAARRYLQKLVRILEYLEIFDAQRLSIKSDANVSVDGGNRVEIKNINGVKDIEAALEHEIRRHKRLQENGEPVERETRTYDAEADRTESLRSKESAEDYGYLTEPDLVRNRITTARVQEVRSSLPELPDAKRARFLSTYGIGTELVDSLVTDRRLADAFEDAVDAVGADLAAAWFSGPIKKTLNYHDTTYRDSPLTSEWVVTVLEKLAAGDISDQAAETVIRDLMEDPRDPKTIIAEKGLEKAGSDELAGIVSDVIADNPDAVDDYRSGDANAINFLVGQIMQRTGGSADPKEARDQLQDHLDA